jgi:hypothetical protein
LAGIEMAWEWKKHGMDYYKSSDYTNMVKVYSVNMGFSRKAG